MAKGELVLALFFAAIGGLWIVKAARMQLWEGFAPDSGFAPLAYGILLTGLAVAVLAVPGGAAGTSGDVRKPLLVLAALTASVAALPFAGFAICVFLLLLFLYGFVERLPLLASALVSAAITGSLYLVFKTWLGVPLP
jgi:hypothetical protein